MKKDTYYNILEKMRRETIVLFPSKMKKEKDFNLCFETLTEGLACIFCNINNLVNKQYSFESDYSLNKLIYMFNKQEKFALDFYISEDYLRFALNSGRNPEVYWDLNVNLKADHNPLLMSRYKMIVIECSINKFDKTFESYIYKEFEKININYQKTLESTSLEIKAMKPLILKLKNSNLQSDMFFENDKVYSLNEIYKKVLESSDIVKLTYDIELKEELKILKAFIDLESTKTIKSKVKNN